MLKLEARIQNEQGDNIPPPLMMYNKAESYSEYKDKEEQNDNKPPPLLKCDGEESDSDSEDNDEFNDEELPPLLQFNVEESDSDSKDDDPTLVENEWAKIVRRERVPIVMHEKSPY